MRLQKYIQGAALLLATLLPTTVSAKSVVTPRMYMFGFAASFNDTIVHFTDIQAVDSVWVDAKTDFLKGRDYYSNSLREYLTKQQMPDRTCIVIYDKNIDRLQKKYLKMKKLYAGTKKVKNRNDIRLISADEFKFTAIDMSSSDGEENANVDNKVKKEKKKKMDNRRPPKRE